MKNIFKYVAALAMCVTLAGLVACGEETGTSRDVFAFQYDGQSVADGATVYFTPTRQEVNSDWAKVSFYLENKTDANVQTVMKVERLSGPAELDNLSICFGETCKTGTCPWTSDAFSLVPGVNSDMPILIEYTPSVINNATSVYRITVGEGSAMDNPRVLLIDITGTEA